MRLSSSHSYLRESFRPLTKLGVLVTLMVLVSCFAPRTPGQFKQIDVARLEDSLKPPVGFLPDGHAWLVFSEGPRAILRYEGSGGSSVSESMVVARACCVIGEAAGYPAMVIVADGVVGGSYYYWLGMLGSVEEDPGHLFLGWPDPKYGVPLFGANEINSPTSSVFGIDQFDFFMGGAARGANREIPK